MQNDAAEKQAGWAWGRRQGAPLKRKMGWDPNKAVEQSFQKELLAEREAGRDVDRLIMTALLARVRETGPNNAFKALASIEVCVCVCVCVFSSVLSGFLVLKVFFCVRTCLYSNALRDRLCVWLQWFMPSNACVFKYDVFLCEKKRFFEFGGLPTNGT